MAVQECAAATGTSFSRRRFLSSIAAIGLASSTQAASGVLCALNTPDSDGAQRITGRSIGPRTSPARTRTESRLHINQAGYLPTEPKRAVVPTAGEIPGNAFTIVDDDVIPSVRYQGVLKEYQSPGAADAGKFRRHSFADFDDLRRPGRYRLRLADGSLSPPFSVRADIYSHLGHLVLKYFDVQQCGRQHSAVRDSCHVDDGVVADGPRAGEPIDCSGGWHDAGDYIKFVETTSYVAALMLFTHERFPKAFPNSTPHGATPLLLRYAKIGLDWLLKMHPSPSEFYYQVGDESDHNSWRLPEADCLGPNCDWKPRPVFFGIGANLAGRTAAALAMASRIYRPYDAAFSRRCSSAAHSAYKLGLCNQKVLTTTPSDFYPEKTWKDDMEWGAIELYKATGRPDFLQDAIRFAHAAGAANDQTSVYNTHAIAHHSLFPYAGHDDRLRLLDYLRTDAEWVRGQADNPYGLGTPYIWGTAEAAAGAAITCLLYAGLSHDKQYVALARRQRDFILGCNPFNICCLIGAGTHYPLFPHHQIANIKNVEISGALVGGPTSAAIFKGEHIKLDDSEFSTQNPGPVEAQDRANQNTVYHDSVQDYVSNEPANDYTAKFLLLTAFYMSAA